MMEIKKYRSIIPFHEWFFVFSLVVCVTGFSLWLLYINTIKSPDSLQWTPWCFYEWLINYQGGFVRRGLVGYFINKNAYGNELHFVNHLVFVLGALYFLLSAAFAIFVIGKPKSVTLYLLSPAGILWMALSNQNYYRKEIFFLICLLLAGLLYQAWRKYDSRFIAAFLVFFIFASSMIMPFVHEAYIFFCVLIFCSMLRSLTASMGPSVAKTIVGSFVIFNISLFLLLSYFKGNGDISSQIWASISPDAQSLTKGIGGLEHGGISAIGWSMKDALKVTVIRILTGMATYYLFPLLVAYLIAGFILSEVKGLAVMDVYKSEHFLSTLLAVVISFLPLIIMAPDWGRWIVGIHVIFLSITIFDLGAPAFFIRWVKGAAENFRTVTILFVILLTISLFTQIPECCIEGSGNSPLNNSATVLFKETLKHLLHQ